MKRIFSFCFFIFILIEIKTQAQTAQFTYTTVPLGSPSCEGVTYDFEDASTGMPTSWDWDFGANAIPTSSTQQNPGLVQFPVCGPDTVTLTLNNGSTISHIIQIWCNPTACFTANPPTACFPTPIQFTSCSSAGSGFISSYIWDFGDGDSSNVTNPPPHNYPIFGCYPVTLIVTNNYGCVADTNVQNAVCLLQGAVSVLNYTIDCATPNVVCFGSTGSIGADTYEWTFSQAGTIYSTSTQDSVCVTFPMPMPTASYLATLKVCNNSSGCCDSVSQIILLRNLVACATLDSIVCYPNGASINNCSIGANSYLWQIYDLCNAGSIVGSSTQQSGQLNFPVPGHYHVLFQAICVNGCRDSLDFDVTVYGLDAGFWGGPLTGCAPFTVSFNDTTSGNCVSNPVLYIWNFGDGSSPDTTTNVTVSHTYTSNGNFTVTETVIDNHGCSSTDSVVAYVNAGLLLSETHIQPSCGFSNGSINLSVNSGTPPYTYSWSNGSTTQDIFSLNAGTYSVTVNDATGCPSVLTVNLQSTNSLSLSETHNNTSCGNSNGSINLTVNGGTFPYNYLWSNNATTQDINNLSAGNYSVTVVDLNNCSGTISITINDNNVLVLSETHSDALCGNSNGMIDLTVSGTSPFIFIWNNSATTEDLSNLGAGIYSVTVTDSTGCSSTLSDTLIGTNALSLSENHTDEFCDSADGAINISVVGGTAPFSFSWSNGDTTEDISNLSAGNYSLTVSDANNCTATSSVTINNHPGPTITVSHIDVSCLTCHDGSATVFITGGTSPYSILWNIGSTDNPIINIDPGVYHVCVTDANGCSVCDSAVVGVASGIFSTDENNFVQIIPNPNNGIFTLTFSNSSAIENIELVNVLGEKVYSSVFRQTQNDNAMQFDFSSHPEGIYFLQVKTEKGVVRKKILITR